MVKCPFCQYDNEEGALFCEQCKSDLATVAPTPAAAAPAPPPAPPAPPERAPALASETLSGGIGAAGTLSAPPEPAPAPPPPAPAPTPAPAPPAAAKLPEGAQPKLVVIRGQRIKQ